MERIPSPCHSWRCIARDQDPWGRQEKFLLVNSLKLNPGSKMKGSQPTQLELKGQKHAVYENWGWKHKHIHSTPHPRKRRGSKPSVQGHQVAVRSHPTRPLGVGDCSRHPHTVVTYCDPQNVVGVEVSVARRTFGLLRRVWPPLEWTGGNGKTKPRGSWTSHHLAPLISKWIDNFFGRGAVKMGQFPVTIVWLPSLWENMITVYSNDHEYW